MSNNCLKAKSFILLLLMKSNRQKQRFYHPKMADLKAWSHGVRKANYIAIQFPLSDEYQLNEYEPKSLTARPYIKIDNSY